MNEPKRLNNSVYLAQTYSKVSSEKEIIIFVTLMSFSTSMTFFFL